MDLSLLFSDREAEQMAKGHIPEDMDDKWFIFFEEGWLYFHRSWTGHCIYAVRLASSPAGMRIAEAWVNRNKYEYNSAGMDSDNRMVEQLFRTHLLS
jgi:hypothetical protein